MGLLVQVLLMWTWLDVGETKIRYRRGFGRFVAYRLNNFDTDQRLSGFLSEEKKDLHQQKSSTFMVVQLGFLEPLEWNKEVQNDYSISRLGGLPVPLFLTSIDRNRPGQSIILHLYKIYNVQHVLVHYDC
jgi:hypothetical protein